MSFHSDVASMEEGLEIQLAEALSGQNFLVPPSPTYNIPFDDWNHARALVTKYPPQIVLWIIREVSCEPRVTSAFSGTGSLPSIFSSHMGVSSIGISRTLPNTLASSSSSMSSLCHDLGGVSAHFREIGSSENVLASPCSEEKEHVMEPRNEASLESTPVLKQSEDRWFCVFDEHNGKSFGRRSDWKKHMNGFHKPEKKAWQCPNCHRIFDQLRNFSQHHLVEHCHRHPCKHSGTATKLRYSKRAFACGRQFCDNLLYSWDEWRDHVAEHLEDGMSEGDWQYNTFFRNLLRREEVHSKWEKYVSDQLGHYNVAARFNWRPRNTLPLRLKLEYCETMLQDDCERLVEDAYRIGLEVRTAQELLDPSTLIIEPSTIRSEADVLCCNPSSELQSALDFNPSFERSGKEPQGALQLSLSQMVAEDGSSITVNNSNLDQDSHTLQCAMSFEQWDTENRWDGYDLAHENFPWISTLK